MDVTSVVMGDTIVFRCGWCGGPTDSEGVPMVMSEWGLAKDLPHAEHVNGECCAEEKTYEQEHNMRMAMYEEEGN